MWKLIPRPVCWWVFLRCVVVPLAIAAAVVVVPSVIAGIAVAVAVAPIVSRVSPIVPIIPVIVVMVIVVVTVSVAAVIAAVVIVAASSVRGAWAVVVVIPIGISLVLSRIRVPWFDLPNWCGCSTIEHVIPALVDGVRSGLTNWALRTMRAFEG